MVANATGNNTPLDDDGESGFIGNISPNPRRRHVLGAIAAAPVVAGSRGAPAAKSATGDYNLTFTLSADRKSLLVTEATEPDDHPVRWPLRVAAFGPGAWFDMEKPEAATAKPYRPSNEKRLLVHDKVNVVAPPHYLVALPYGPGPNPFAIRVKTHKTSSESEGFLTLCPPTRRAKHETQPVLAIGRTMDPNRTAFAYRCAGETSR